jgi:hypothetical protein
MRHHPVGRRRYAALIAALVAGCSVAGCSDDPAPKTLDRAALLDPESCKECHQEHYEEWAGSMHAYAADDPVFIAMNRRGQEETNGALGDFCVNCHAPMAVREGATTDGLNLAELPQQLKGVTCYFCHSVDAVEGTHNNPLRLANDLTLRGPFADPTPNDAHEAAYSPLLDRNQIDSASLCGSCHDIVTDSGVHLERTFAEWQESVFGNGAAGGLACAQCHMPSRPGVAANVPGVPIREVNGHRMPAVDVALTPWPHHEEHQQEVAEEISGTAIGQLCVDSFDPSLFEVTLENAFAGHSFPSGASQDRRVWVEIVAYDATDALIYESGVVAPGEAVAELDDPDLWLFADRLFDAEDNEVHMFWEAARVESALMPPAIEPMMRHSVSHAYDMPEAPERVEMRVLMEPLGREVLASLIDSGHLDASFADVPTYEVLGLIEWRAGMDQCVPPDVF